MNRWANYGIFRVKYGQLRTSIVEVEARADNGEQFGPVERFTKSAVISAIDQGLTLVTVYERDGKYHKGEDVGSFSIGISKHIRTDGNKTLADNLGELPEYR